VVNFNDPLPCSAHHTDGMIPNVTTEQKFFPFPNIEQGLKYNF